MPAADNAERRAGARTLRDLLPSGLYRRLWFRTRSTACKRKTGRGLKLLAKQSFAAERITAGRELHPAPKIAYLYYSVPRVFDAVKMQRALVSLICWQELNVLVMR